MAAPEEKWQVGGADTWCSWMARNGGLWRTVETPHPELRCPPIRKHCCRNSGSRAVADPRYQAAPPPVGSLKELSFHQRSFHC
jgi:hypothetical protein